MATENKKKDPMDIDALIEKVSKLPISDIEKADLLRKFKENMINPERGEIENLNRIQSKYSSMYSGTTPSPVEFLPSINPNINPNMGQMMMMPQFQMQQQQGIMTAAHFEVLKNKMDSIQLELVDLLRHVKDYTQRYMNATRQQDMEKIDAYINGLFEVDKKMKRAEEQAAMMSAEEDAETAAAGPEKSTITRATDGIKNFLGGIGDGVSGITNFVSSTASIVNDTLSKKVLSNSDKPATATANTATATTNESAKSNTSNTNKGNIVNVDEYIQSNMNQIEGAKTNSNANPNANSNTNPNNITISDNLNNISKPVVKKEVKTETAEDNQEEITSAITKLNDTMNADIDNTVSQGEKAMNTPQTGGSRKENHLSSKIRMLRLRLTKRKLESELYSDGKNKTINRIKVSNKSRVRKTMKNKK
jgi:hypothetical protein